MLVFCYAVPDMTMLKLKLVRLAALDAAVSVSVAAITEPAGKT